MNIDLTQIFSALSNEARLRCLYLVAINDDACVCEIVETLHITQPSASKALNTLRGVGLLSMRREGNWNYFSINDAMPGWTKAIVDAAVEGLGSSRSHAADQKRFRQLDLRNPDAVYG